MIYRKYFLSILDKIVNYTLFSLAIVRYCRFLKRHWKTSIENQQNGQVLLDYYPFSPLLAIYAYFANRLSSRYSAEIVAFKYNDKANKSNLLKMLYRAFNTKKFIHENPGKWKKNSHAIETAKAMIKGVVEKNDVKHLKYNAINFGESVYLTYLRRTKTSTVNVHDKKLIDITAEAIHLVDFWYGYCRSNKVQALISSHDAYIEYYIPMAVIRACHGKVYLLKDETVEFKTWDDLNSRFAYLECMEQAFTRLSRKEKQNALDWSRERLQKRLTGQNTDLYYAKKQISAFSKEETKSATIHESGKTKILIATSSPYDNPLVYGDFLFEDFNEWLQYLGKLSQKTDYSWYVKMHPWADEFYQKEIQSIAEKFPAFSILPLDTSFNAVYESGVRVVLTPYGTVGHELPMLGFTVVNAGRNPHTSYNFCVTPKTQKEYEHVILNLTELQMKYDVDSIYSFYYLQYNYIKNDRIIFGSSREMSEYLGWEKRFSHHFFNWHRTHFDQSVHDYSIRIIDEFLDSESAYIFREGVITLDDLCN